MTEGYYRRTAAIVGALFIIATVTALASGTFLGSALDGPDYLLKLPENENNIITASIFETILAISLVGIGALMFPVLRKHVEGLGMAYAGIRFVEAIFIIISTVCLLLMLTMGQDYASGELDGSTSEPIGALLMALREWSFLFGTLIFLGLGGLVLNYVLFVSRLVPRWLSAWGLVGDCSSSFTERWAMSAPTRPRSTPPPSWPPPSPCRRWCSPHWLIVKGFSTPTNAAGV